jgi:hypothetical protein
MHAVIPIARKSQPDPVSGVCVHALTLSSSFADCDLHLRFSYRLLVFVSLLVGHLGWLSC